MKMDTPPTGSSNVKVDLIKVITTHFDVMLRGRPLHPTAEQMNLHQGSSEELITTQVGLQLLRTGFSVQQALVYSVAEKKLVDLNSSQVAPCFFEQQDYQLFIKIKSAGIRVTFQHDNYRV